jgi:hypothetical protein
MHEVERRRGRSAVGQQREVAKVSDEGADEGSNQEVIKGNQEERQMREAIRRSSKAIKRTAR